MFTYKYNTEENNKFQNTRLGGFQRQQRFRSWVLWIMTLWLVQDSWHSGRKNAAFNFIWASKF